MKAELKRRKTEATRTAETRTRFGNETALLVSGSEQVTHRALVCVR